MADSGIIDEFLIAIGFKFDEAGQRRYQDTIAGIEKGAAVLATSLTGAAVAATAAVNKISTDLASLFYNSQSLHATATGMTALDRAFQDLAGSSEKGRSAFASFAEAMRTNEAFKKFVEKDTGKAFPEGHTEEAFVEVQNIYQKKLAAAKGNRELTAHINALFEAQFKIPSWVIDAPLAKLKEIFEKKEKELGPGYAKATEDAKNLRIAINDLGNAFKDLAIAAAAPLFAPLKTLFEWLAKWIDDNKVFLIGFLKEIWVQIGKAAHDLDVVFGPVLRGMKALWDGLMEGIKAVIGGDNTGLKSLHLLIALILGMVTIGVMTAMASMLTLGFAPFGTLALVLTGILATLTAINALFGGSASAAPASGAGSIPGGGAQTYGGEAGAGGSGHIGGRASGGEPRGPPGMLYGPQLPDQARGKRAGLGDRYKQAMRIAEDQLRKEGVPEGNLRAAAAIMVGNASAESELDPTTIHDSGTGYGIYGARLDRRTKMLDWLASHKYAKDSLEGQTRYMAIEAHKRGGKGWTALKGATAETLGEQGKIFEGGPPGTEYSGGFENPGRTNDRSSQIRDAYAAHRMANPLAGLKPIPPRAAPAPGAFVPQADADAWVKQHFPMDKPLDLGRQSSLHINDSRSVKHETNINVVGGGDAAPATERSIDMAGLLGHLQGNSA